MDELKGIKSLQMMGVILIVLELATASAQGRFHLGLPQEHQHRYQGVD